MHIGYHRRHSRINCHQQHHVEQDDNHNEHFELGASCYVET